MKVEKHAFDEFVDVDSGCHSGKCKQGNEFQQWYH